MMIHAFTSWSLVGRSAMQAQKSCLGTLLKPSPVHSFYRIHFSIAMSTEIKNVPSEQDWESVPAAKRNYYNDQDNIDSTKAIRLKNTRKRSKFSRRAFKSKPFTSSIQRSQKA